MKYIWGARSWLGAGRRVTENTWKRFWRAAGVRVEEPRGRPLTAALEGVNIDEALKAAVAMSAPAPAAAPAAEKKEEKKKEEKKEEEKVSEDEAAAGPGARFG